MIIYLNETNLMAAEGNDMKEIQLHIQSITMMQLQFFSLHIDREIERRI